MKKQLFKLDKAKLKSLYLAVLKGYTVCEETKDFDAFYIKHLDMHSSTDIDEAHSYHFERAKDKGLPTEKDQLKYLNKEELWTDKEEMALVNQEEMITRLKLSKSKLFLQSQIDYFNEQIEKETIILHEEMDKKSQMVGFTAETYANKKINEFYIYNTIYRDRELKNLFFKKEEFEYINFENFSKLIKAYNENTQYSNSLNLKRVALSTFFLNYFYLCDDNPQIFFGQPVVNLTYHQVELFGYARHFKHAMTELKSKPPEEYYDDPDKLMEYVDAGKNAEKMIEKTQSQQKEHSAMSVVGATKEDLERMGLSAGNHDIGAVDLSQAASKKDGSLDMDDLIKIHEKGHL